MHLINRTACWVLTPPTDYRRLLGALLDVAPAGSVLYFEGNGTPTPVRRFFQSRALPGKGRLPGGTWLPTPDVFHLLITAQNMAGLRSILGAPEVEGIPTHIHVYHGDSMILQWYDASAGDPIVISADVDEAKVKTLCQAAGCSYVCTVASKPEQV